MQTTHKNLFTAIRTEGGILPADLLQRIASGDRDIEGLTPEFYHLAGSEKLNEAINRSWNHLLGVWATFRDRVSSGSAGRLPSSGAGADAGSGSAHSKTATGYVRDASLAQGSGGSATSRGMGTASPLPQALTGPTRERWLLPLFQELGYGRLLPSRATEIEGKDYPISHFWQHTPLHLIGCGLDIDRRTPGAVGAARMSPHGLMQEFLNRSEDHLWAIVTNGLRLRILRDNVSLTRQAYVEFDLETMMDGEVYSDFTVLWLLCHQSRVESERPEQCWLEKWSQVAQDQGTRALEQLRTGVEEAISALGSGFLAHPANTTLKARLRSGELDKQDYYRQLLRIVYRVLFLFVAEDRDVLLDPAAPVDAKERFTRWYSTTRLRNLAAKHRGTDHPDLWHMVRLIFRGLGADSGCPELALPALGSFLWSDAAVPDLIECELRNRELLTTVRALAITTENNVRRAVDFKNLGSEELGSVYESLLELHPELNADTATFELNVAAGHERKTTGSYYTPSSLVNCLLDSALDPVLDEAAKKPDPEQTILDLKACDPACGSGHFLIAAAHRVARRLAAVRTGDDEPSPDAYRHALRDVVAHCIYGVDINPMAVELCKVSLWLEALEPGRPLSFLDHHIQCGNSLLGTTPRLMRDGIPDDAFKPIEGDEKAYCREYKAENRKQRKSKQGMLFDVVAMKPWEQLGSLAVAIANVDEIDDSSLAGVRAKQERYEETVRGSGYLFNRLLADAWCAAFVWRKAHSDDLPYPITEEVYRKIERNPHSCPAWMRAEIQRLVDQYQFFHWHLAFPDVFRVPASNEEPESEQTGWNGGFDVVLGNPPWEAEELVEKEFFASAAPEIAAVNTKAKRTQLIERLELSRPDLYESWLSEKRLYAARSHLCKTCGVFPNGCRGKLNTYRLFAELASLIGDGHGRIGQILKTGIVTAQDSQPLFQHWVEGRQVVSSHDFINTEKLFPDVVSNERFCLLVLTGTLCPCDVAEYAFGLTNPSQLSDSSRTVRVHVAQLKKVNPDDLSIPPVGSPHDFELLAAMHHRHPVLRSEANDSNPWQIHYTQGHLNSATGSSLFRDNTFEALTQGGATLNQDQTFERDGHALYPLYEGKFIGQMNHRFGTFAGVPIAKRFGTKAEANAPSVQDLGSPSFEITPRYWLDEENASSLYRKKGTRFEWLFAFRDVCRAIVDARTVQACVLPKMPCLDGCPLLVFEASVSDASHAGLLMNALWASFVFDYAARQKIHGAHLTKAIACQLPVPAPASYQTRLPEGTFDSFVNPRSLELTVVTNSLLAFAKDCGYDGPPFRWDEERRFLLRCELDAAYFHLYGIERDDVDYIMETFPIVKRRDEAAHGSYRTKDTILETYDQMAHAIATGNPYQTWLEPAPGPPTDANGNFIPMAQWDTASWPEHIHDPRG